MSEAQAETKGRRRVGEKRRRQGGWDSLVICDSDRMKKGRARKPSKESKQKGHSYPRGPGTIHEIESE